MGLCFCVSLQYKRREWERPENGTGKFASGGEGFVFGGIYRLGSKAGVAMGENSQLMVKMPSNLRSG